MKIYAGMDNHLRNKILMERYSLLGIPLKEDNAGNIIYIPDIDDRTHYYENCENQKIKSLRLVSMNNPYGDDSWTELY